MEIASVKILDFWESPHTLEKYGAIPKVDLEKSTELTYRIHHHHTKCVTLSINGLNVEIALGFRQPLDKVCGRLLEFFFRHTDTVA